MIELVMVAIYHDPKLFLRNKKKIMYYVGLDMSLRSPGMSVYHSSTKTLILFGWKQLKRHECFQGYEEVCDMKNPLEIKKLQIRLFDQLPTERWECITQVVDDITSFLKVVPKDKVKIAIEGYAHNMQNSSSKSVLNELGGALRYRLMKLGLKWEEVSPKSAKKVFGKHGNCSKDDMINKYFDYGFNCDYLSPTKMTDHPNEDMVDALAICCALFEGQTTQDKKKKRKVPIFKKKPVVKKTPILRKPARNEQKVETEQQRAKRKLQEAVEKYVLTPHNESPSKKQRA